MGCSARIAGDRDLCSHGVRQSLGLRREGPVCLPQAFVPGPQLRFLGQRGQTSKCALYLEGRGSKHVLDVVIYLFLSFIMYVFNQDATHVTRSTTFVSEHMRWHSVCSRGCVRLSLCDLVLPRTPWTHWPAPVSLLPAPGHQRSALCLRSSAYADVVCGRDMQVWSSVPGFFHGVSRPRGPSRSQQASQS